MLKNKKYGGFTLLEMLVVVLIIGILAGIALPQYEKAVTKARVASILPIMRRWYDALQEYKLQHGSYLTEYDNCPDGSDLGANWPSDWKTDEDEPCEDNGECINNYWDCFINDNGSVNCQYKSIFNIIMLQHDDNNDESCYSFNKGKIVCDPRNDEGEKICKSLGKPSGTSGSLQCTVIGG